MPKDFYDFGNFRQLLDEEGEEELQGKENEDFKNIWEPSKDENAFYEKIHDFASKYDIQFTAPNTEELKKDNLNLCKTKPDGLYKLVFSNTLTDMFQGLLPLSVMKIDKLSFPYKFLKKREEPLTENWITLTASFNYDLYKKVENK